jgi:hypothetical protein
MLIEVMVWYNAGARLLPPRRPTRPTMLTTGPMMTVSLFAYFVTFLIRVTQTCSRVDKSDSDIEDDSRERRMTLMEEALLLGLKDREVRASHTLCALVMCAGVHIILERLHQ